MDSSSFEDGRDGPSLEGKLWGDSGLFFDQDFDFEIGDAYAAKNKFDFEQTIHTACFLSNGRYSERHRKELRVDRKGFYFPPVKREN